MLDRQIGYVTYHGPTVQGIDGRSYEWALERLLAGEPDTRGHSGEVDHGLVYPIGGVAAKSRLSDMTLATLDGVVDT